MKAKLLKKLREKGRDCIDVLSITTETSFSGKITFCRFAFVCHAKMFLSWHTVYWHITQMCCYRIVKK